MRNPFSCRESLVSLLSVGLALALLSGCGGGAAAPSDTGTFFGDPVPLNSGTLRGYVTLDHGVVTAVGSEITNAALTGLPNPAFGQAQATFGSLPSQASATPFKQIAMAYFTGHSPAGAGDKPHFHPLFLLNPPQQPDPPAFALETTPVAANEVPADHVALADIAPGIGVAFQDPAQPQAQPGWDSTGQNYFFYNGHMNAIVLGATNAYLLRTEAGLDIARGDVIKQPQVFPAPGIYPQRYTVHYDGTRHVHVFELSDFARR